MILNRLLAAGALLLAVALLGAGAALLRKAAPAAGPPAPAGTQPQALTKRAEAPDGGANAALPYGQAFIALRRGLQPVGEKKLKDECLTMPLGAGAREVVARAAYALRMLRRGAARTRCDWAVGLGRGFELPFSHGDGARVLSSLACLRARLRLEEGRPAEAVEDLVAALTLARHVSRDGTLDSLKAGYALERLLGEALALALPRLDAGTLKGLNKRLEALPAAGSPATATLRAAEELLNWVVGEVREATDKESLLAFLSQLCGDSRESPAERRAKGRAFLKECGGTAKGVLRRAEEARAPVAALAKKLDLAPAPSDGEWEREVKKRSGNPVFKVFAPVLQSVRWRQAQAHVRRALLAAAVAVQLEGKGALKKHPDPLVGGQFEYVAFKGGFELRSRWKPDERFAEPVALTVGRRGGR
jgi:hypothetical protein